MRMLLALLLALSLGSRPLPAAADTTVVVVRHAEKATDDPRDPNLSEVGLARAATLARALADYPLTAAYVTGYRRTLQTAEPTLREHGVTARAIPVTKEPVEIQAQRLLERIQRESPGGVILVVGHSNTVPALVFAFTGVQVPPLVEASEFNRLYVITLPAQGRPRLVAARY